MLGTYKRKGNAINKAVEMVIADRKPRVIIREKNEHSGKDVFTVLPATFHLEKLKYPWQYEAVVYRPIPVCGYASRYTYFSKVDKKDFADKSKYGKYLVEFNTHCENFIDGVRAANA